MIKKVLYLQNSHVKTLAFFGLLIIFSLFGFSQAFGYGGGGTYSPSVPVNVTSINVPLTISNTQAGTITQSFSDSSQVLVSVPKGAVEGQTTFTASQGTLRTDNTPGQTTGAFMVGGAVYNITAKDVEDNEVRNFSDNLSITLTIPAISNNTADLGVYYFSDLDNEWVLVPGAVFDSAVGQVVFEVSHLTIFAVIKAIGLPSVLKVESAAAAENAGESVEEPAETVSWRPYGDGFLVRGSNYKIYVILNQKKKYISSIAELAQYKGQAIANVADRVISQYEDYGAGVQVYADGSLLRGPDKKIYVINNGRREHIPTLAKLRAYAGQAIIDVNSEVLAGYQELASTWQVGEGSLIRTPDYKVYRIENGAKRYVSTLEELRQYAGVKIYNISFEVLAGY